MALNADWQYIITGDEQQAKVPWHTPTGSDVRFPRHDFTEVATIASSAAESDAIDLGGAVTMSLEWPTAWTAADLTFMASLTLAGTYRPMYDDAGVEVKIASANLPTADASGRFICNDDILRKVCQHRFIKLVSGVDGAQVNQGAERTITLVLKG